MTLLKAFVLEYRGRMFELIDEWDEVARFCDLAPDLSDPECVFAAFRQVQRDHLLSREEWIERYGFPPWEEEAALIDREGEEA